MWLVVTGKWAFAEQGNYRMLLLWQFLFSQPLSMQLKLEEKTGVFQLITLEFSGRNRCSVLIQVNENKTVV